MSPGLQLSRPVSTNKASFQEDTSPGLQLSTRVSTIVKLPFMKIRTLVHSIRDESLLLKFPFAKIRARDHSFKNESLSASKVSLHEDMSPGPQIDRSSESEN